MTRTDLASIEGAAAFAAAAHHGQIDKSGIPYIFHPLRVALRLIQMGPDYVITGLLHDVVEDTDYTVEDLANRGAPDHIVAAVTALTKIDREPYEDALARATSDPIAAWVKAADVADNAGRIDGIADQETRERLRRKYGQATEYLAAKGLVLS